MKHRIRNIFEKGTASGRTGEEHQEMLSLFHRPEAEYDLKEYLLEALDRTDQKEYTPRLKELFSRIWHVIEKEEVREDFKKRFLNTGVKIAAAIVVGLLTGIITTTLLIKQEPVYYTAHSPRGSVSEWILPDSTTIFLNSGSRLRYTMESKDHLREVFLEGEAWFDVKKEKKKPFLVHTPLYDVAVTGTQFNVKAYPSENRVITTLEEGQIILQSSAHIELQAGAVLNPGEQAMLSGDSGELSIKRVDPRYFTAWRNNKLIFMNMNLRELIVLLERKFGVDIEVKDPSILNYHCDGTFKSETIIEVMQIIQKTLPIEYEIVGQKIEITSNQK